ncbi:MAG: 30S ribosome-binding factor RbfA [Myxococcota bacterium]
MSKGRPSKRTERLASSIQQVLAVALQRETHEEALHQVVVTGVDVTRDLSLARVYYYLMSGDPDEVGEAFERAQGFLRTRVGQQVRMRHTPELRFHYDEAIDRGRRVDAILRDLDIPPEDATDEDG